MSALHCSNPLHFSDDIGLAYYTKYYSHRIPKLENGGNDAGIPEGIVEQIRREKVEKAYTAWLEKLKSTLPIEVNQELWTTIMGANAGSGAEKQAKPIPSEK